jgi:hypothetical protein
MHIGVRRLSSALLGLALTASLPAAMHGFPGIALAEMQIC